MDDRLLYSFMLMVSLMFLCLLLPLDSKEMKDIQNNATTDSLDQWLIAYLLYPNLIAKLLSERGTTSQFIIDSNQIKLVDLKRASDTDLLVTVEFSSFLSTEPVADYRVAYQIDALGNMTTQSFETVTIYQEEEA